MEFHHVDSKTSQYLSKDNFDTEVYQFFFWSNKGNEGNKEFRNYKPSNWKC